MMGQSRSVRRTAEALIAWTVVARLLLRFTRAWRLRGFWALAKSALDAAYRRTAALVPGVESIVAKEVEKELAKIEAKMLGDGDEDALLTLPQDGVAGPEVAARTAELRRDETPSTTVERCKRWSGTYMDKESTELTDMQAAVWAQYNTTNALYPGVFPSIRRFEAEIVAMAVDLLCGEQHQGRQSSSDGPCGLLTSGGTESIVLAMLAYREQGRREKGIERGQVVACTTAHPALNKACHFFELDLILLPPDPQTQRLRPSDVATAITADTVCVYTSAPTFPHGVVDPVADIAAVAKAAGVGVHVDNCLGGFYLSFLQRCGRFTPAWDFRVRGVTSVSIDVHKYGFASKVTTGPSLYVTSSLQGARSGAVVAVAWATLVHHGQAGYAAAARRLHGVFDKVVSAVEACADARLLCMPDLAVIPITSDTVNIYTVASLMEERGWNTFTCRDPPCMSLCYGVQHEFVADDWIADFLACVAAVKADPTLKPSGDAAVYGAAKTLPTDVLEQVMRGYCDVKMSVKKLSK